MTRMPYLPSLRSAWAAVFIFGALLLGVEPGAAQTANSDSARAGGCARAAQVIARQQRGPDYRAAVTNLRSCPAQASRVLAAEWRRMPADSQSLNALGDASGRVRDRGLYRVVADVARDGSRSRAERVAALQALAIFYNPKVSMRVRNLERAGLGGASYLNVGILSHPLATDGPDPLDAGTKQDVLQLLEGLGRRDADPVVRASASHLAQTLPQLP